MLRLWRAAVLHLLLSIDDYLMVRVLMLSLLLCIFIYVVFSVRDLDLACKLRILRTTILQPTILAIIYFNMLLNLFSGHIPEICGTFRMQPASIHAIVFVIFTPDHKIRLKLASTLAV